MAPTEIEKQHNIMRCVQNLAHNNFFNHISEETMGLQFHDFLTKPKVLESVIFYIKYLVQLVLDLT